MHTLTLVEEYLYHKDEREQPLNLQSRKFSFLFLVPLSTLPDIFFLIILLIFIFINFVALLLFCRNL
jgi:hypothetical protein